MIDPRYDYKELHTNRASGILLPLFSLPSPYGIGSLGSAAYTFIDFLKTAGQKYWQILPLGPTGYGNSPYSSMSSFAGNPYFIDLDLLAEEGLLLDHEIQAVSAPANGRIDYGFLYRTRLPLLQKAYRRFITGAGGTEQLHAFSAAQGSWLEDYVLFFAIRTHVGDTAWYTWPQELRNRRSKTVADMHNTLTDKIGFAVFLQYLFEKQWQALKAYAGKAGIEIIGDLPIYCAHDSADVWAHPEVFCINADGSIAFVGGCPPPDFEITGDLGQVWGTPVYNWEYLKTTGYRWMLDRFKRQADFYDVVRLDHFRGYEGFWRIPFGNTGRTGSWEPAGGAAFFSLVQRELPSLRIIAEDLGYITKEVADIRKHFGYPSMRILQQGIFPSGSNEHTPHHYDPATVLYFGIHDNDPLYVWLAQRNKNELDYFYDYFNLNKNRPIQLELMKAMSATAADTVIYQVQDLLLLNECSRINVPGSAEGNWEFQLSGGHFNALTELSDELRRITRMYGRS
ncbi:MAG: 4-alpha-glucanotransferase [Treponema sp.]